MRVDVIGIFLEKLLGVLDLSSQLLYGLSDSSLQSFLKEPSKEEEQSGHAEDENEHERVDSSLDFLDQIVLNSLGK